MPAVLGISAFYHDSAAALVDGQGRILAAAQQERFSRRKHDAGFPAEAIVDCLEMAGVSLDAVSQVVFYDKPLLKFERLLDTYFAFSPRGLRSYLTAMPVWLKDKLYLKSTLRQELSRLSGLARSALPPLRFTEHHQAHAAAAFYPSPFETAAVLCVDGVGEWATTSAWLGRGGDLQPLWEQHFPHSLGLLYSTFTEYLGFRVNSGEYKLMGLAAYGEPRFAALILQHLLALETDGSFRLDMRYFAFATGLRMSNRRFHDLFGRPPRQAEAPIEAFHQDLASSIQAVTETVLLRLARTLREQTGVDCLCLGGGVAQNSTANGRLLRSGIFDRVWAPPAGNDAGSAVGAALCGVHLGAGVERGIGDDDDNGDVDGWCGAGLGSGWDGAAVDRILASLQAEWEQPADAELIERVAAALAAGAVVAWFEGRMEFGPRALGHRSILADPRRAGVRDRLNRRVKRRETFRPFAPVVLAERAGEFFEIDRPSPYMQFVTEVRSDFAQELAAVTHVDGSARVQTLEARQHPRLHALLEAFARRSGVPVLLNTSFNRRGEPLVRTPAEAYACFMDTDIDHLVIEGRLLDRTAQRQRNGCWARTFEPD